MVTGATIGRSDFTVRVDRCATHTGDIVSVIVEPATSHRSLSKQHSHFSLTLAAPNTEIHKPARSTAIRVRCVATESKVAQKPVATWPIRHTRHKLLPREFTFAVRAASRTKSLTRDSFGRHQRRVTLKILQDTLGFTDVQHPSPCFDTIRVARYNTVTTPNTLKTTATLLRPTVATHGLVVELAPRR